MAQRDFEFAPPSVQGVVCLAMPDDPAVLHDPVVLPVEPHQPIAPPPSRVVAAEVKPEVPPATDPPAPDHGTKAAGDSLESTWVGSASDQTWVGSASDQTWVGEGWSTSGGTSSTAGELDWCWAARELDWCWAKPDGIAWRSGCNGGTPECTTLQ